MEIIENEPSAADSFPVAPGRPAAVTAASAAAAVVDVLSAEVERAQTLKALFTETGDAPQGETHHREDTEELRRVRWSRRASPEKWETTAQARF